MVSYLINQKKKTMIILAMLHLKMVGGGKGFGGFGGFSSSDFSDIFEDFFGDFGGGGRSSRKNSNNRGSDLRHDLSISLEEAYTGKKQNIQFSTSEKCITCKGNGSKTRIITPERCSYCGGNGRVHQINVFTEFNKLAHNVQVQVRKLQIHVMIVMVKEIDKLQKNICNNTKGCG